LNTLVPFSRPRLAIVIPCYGVLDHIVDVVRGIPPWVDCIFAVDDACPQKSGQHLARQCADPRLKILYHEKNQGVGGAVITGYQAALAAGCDIVVKMDGDNQMDPAFLPRLLQPILIGHADFTKGNRFYDLGALRQMPFIRRTGNLGLTLLTKAASGYWNVADPTNGYTAVHASALRMLNFEQLSRRYFFESSMLIQLNIARAVAHDVPIPARYGSETSSLNAGRAFFGFPPRLIAGFFRRLLWRYFIHDISAVTVLLLCGSLSAGFGVGFGAYRWIVGQVERQAQTAGTVALALLPTLLGFQMLLQAILLDVTDRHTIPLQTLMNDTPPPAAAFQPKGDTGPTGRDRA
jgi:dolichol-phosphate mannosyltransferase